MKHVLIFKNILTIIKLDFKHAIIIQYCVFCILKFYTTLLFPNLKKNMNKQHWLYQ